jgi:hypothetical protein
MHLVKPILLFPDLFNKGKYILVPQIRACESGAASSLPGARDLQYWFFYPFNGPGRMRVQFGEVHDATSSLAPLGDYYGDWEMVILRFDSTTYDKIGLDTKAHALEQIKRIIWRKHIS